MFPIIELIYEMLFDIRLKSCSLVLPIGQRADNTGVYPLLP